jgi:hypothetical protein
VRFCDFDFAQQSSSYEPQALRRAWGKARRPPRLPHHYGTGTVPLHTATVRLGEVTYTETLWRQRLRQTGAAYDALMAGTSPVPAGLSASSACTALAPKITVRCRASCARRSVTWWASFLCVDGGTGFRTTRGLDCVEHTRIGVFGDMDIAVQAAEIAMRMDDWASFDFDKDSSMQLVMRVRTA